MFLDCACLSVKGFGNSATEWTCKIVADNLRTSSFKISWSMHGKTGGLIETVDGYEDMIEQLKGTKGDVKLLLEELVPPPVPGAQPLDKNADDEGQKKKKSKVHNPSDEEKQIHNFIEKLTTQYVCHDAKCCSPRCLINPTGKHILLTPQHMRVWAAVLVNIYCFYLPSN
ncbi:hypothetical protein BT96DRAFT_943215 [Gymnopus androsaceus JB14]|uniref:Uncharacterized protein n=1 Tax=Gymnopus androsaceus JB14 TaxID=1447944 RepID=A0A6A4HAP7_9AGAR|nr:hypothetical protein BT96DRAFT_943215 [Gymnopus androsaceus JB14]